MDLTSSSAGPCTGSWMKPSLAFLSLCLAFHHKTINPSFGGNARPPYKFPLVGSTESDNISILPHCWDALVVRRSDSRHGCLLVPQIGPGMSEATPLTYCSPTYEELPSTMEWGKDANGKEWASNTRIGFCSSFPLQLALSILTYGRISPIVGLERLHCPRSPAITT